MKRKLLLMTAALLCAVGVRSQGWTSSAVAEGDYYLYNVGAAAYFSHGGRYGTHATVDNVGIAVNLTKVSDGVYTIGTNATYTSKYFNSNGYADSGSTDWTFEAVAGEDNTYKIKNGDNYAYVEWGLHNVMVGSDPGNSRAYWKLVTSTNRSTLTGASSSNPQDVTHLFDNPNFNYGNGDWVGGLTLGGNVNPAYNNWDKNGENDEASWNNHNPNVESYNSASFDMNQTKTGLTSGFYRVTCQGYYRAGDGGTTTMTQNVSLYANDASSLLMNINSGAQAHAEWNYTAQVGTTDLYVPDAQYQASNVLSTGAYSNNSVEVNVTDGSLKIGVKKTTKIDKDWTIVDNFHVYYLGNPKATLTTLQGTIDGSYLNNATYTNVGGSERTALTSAKTLTAASETAAAYETAISTVQDAIDAFVAAKDNYDALAAINAKITAVGTLTYASSAKKPSTHVGTSSSDAASYATSLTTALRAYVESNALGEGVSATDYTSSIAEPSCVASVAGEDKSTYDNGTWTCSSVRANGGAGYTNASGTTKAFYFDSNGWFWSYNVSSASLRQTLSSLPTGKYLLSVTSKADAGVTLTLAANDKNTICPNGESEGVFGNGWDDTSLEFTVGSSGIVEISLTGTGGTAKSRYFSADNFRLVRIGDLDAVAMNENTSYTPVAGTYNVTLTRSFDTSNWATFVVPFDIDEATLKDQFGDGVKVCTISASDKTGVSFSDVMANPSITANTPVIMKVAQTADSYTFNGVEIKAGSTTKNLVDGVDLVGNYGGDITIPTESGYSFYYIASNQLKKSNGTQKSKGFRAYFKVANDASVKAFFDNGFNFDDADAIQTIEAENAENTVLYNLAGQRVSRAYKGLYIVNGKKVSVK